MSLINVALWALAVVFSASSIFAQEVRTKNASSWMLSGLAQLQYLYNAEIDGDAGITNNGFRVRTGRLQAKGKLTDWVETKFQIEVRDNSPRLKDLEGRIKLGANLFVRFGQFKVPVWREELRSSSRLLLIERSEVANFLAGFNLSARQIGFELGGIYDSGVSWAANFSNGSGEGVREDAGRNKSLFVNNGKMLSGRVNFPAGDKFEIGVSAVANHAGGVNQSGAIWTIAPDFGLGVVTGEDARIDVEGGIAVGGVSSALLGTPDDMNFTVFDITGRWLKQLAQANANLGGLDAVQLGAGLAYVEPNSEVSDDEFLVFRFGPAVYFGKKARLQVNGEVLNFAADAIDTEILLRAQTTFVF